MGNLEFLNPSQVEGGLELWEFQQLNKTFQVIKI